MIRNNFENYTKDVCISKDWIVPYSQIKKGSTILLYGAGDVGQAYYNQIKITDYCEIVAWIDKDADVYQKIGINVELPEKIVSYSFDYVLIAVSDSNIARKINTKLLDMGVEQEKIIWKDFERIPFIKNPVDYYLNSTVENEILRVLYYKNISRSSAAGYKYFYEIKSLVENNKLVIPRAVLQLTQKCSLRCSGCNNLMPLFQHPDNYDYEDIIGELDDFRKKVDRILILELIGGEPLLYPDIASVIKYISKIKEIDILEITTNGTLVPTDETMKALGLINSCIRISKYKKSNRINEIIEKCREYGVVYKVLDNLEWFDSGAIEKRFLTDAELRGVYGRCPSSRLCKTISNGKLFCCSRAASLYDLGICKEDDNYIELSTCKREDIINFYAHCKASACDYCTCTDEWRNIPPGQ